MALGSLDRGGPGNDLLETQLSLDVYLSGKRIGTLWPNGGDELDPPGRSGCSFAYRPEVVEETAGARLLSYAMPVRAEPYGPRDTFPYLEGLLPQGKWRHLMAAELGIAPGDGYALIAALGRDCPGAVTFMPAGAAPGNHVGDTLAWLDADELEELVGAEEPERLLDPVREQRMRFALAGESYKLALIRDAQGGRWAWPEPGAPSTHIVKPQREDRPGSAVAELACTMALREMGLPIVHVEVDEIAGRTCLISKRFDRWGEGIGVERIHQESISQALGWGPGCPARGKRPGYAESRRLLKALGEEEGVRALFTIAYCRFLIGCREEGFGEDAALLYAGREPLLSPFFGITASLAYDPAASASLEELVFRNSCLARLARVAVECDYPFEAAVAAATEAIGGLCLALNGVAGRARSEGWYEPVIDEIRERVFEHMKSFRSEVHLFSPTSRGGSRRT